MTSRCPRTSALVAAAVAWALPVGAAQTPIVLTGDATPGGDASFASFRSPVLNNAQQLAFTATLTATSSEASNDGGVFRASAAHPGLLTVAREGQTVPGGNGKIGGTDPFSFGIDASGRVAFINTLTDTLGGATDRTALFLGGDAGLTQIARQGQPAPDGNGAFSTIANGFSLSDTAHIAFVGSLSDTAEGFVDRIGLFRAAGGPLTQLSRSGQPAPGGGTFSHFGDPRLTASNQTIFAATLQVPGSFNSQGLFAEFDNEVTQYLRSGQTAPDGDGQYGHFYDPVVNVNGQIAVNITLTGANSSSGIFLVSDGTVTQLVREGQSVPGGNGKFDRIIRQEPPLNAAGQMAFHAELLDTSGGAADNFGVFRASSSAITTIARRGQAVPEGNGTLSGMITGPMLNEPGHVVYHASLAGTAGGTADNSAILIGDGTDLLVVARKGQALLGSTVTSLALTSSSRRHRMGLNDNGQVAYAATLADGRSAIVLFTPDLRWRSSVAGQWSNAANWTLGIAPAALYQVSIDPASPIEVAGPSTPTTIRSLTLGAPSGAGVTTLRLADGDLTSLESAVVRATGRLVVESQRNFTTPGLAHSGSLEVMHGGRAVLTSAITGAGSVTVRGRLDTTTGAWTGAVDSLVVEGGTIDLADNALVIRSGDPSELQAAIASARNAPGGLWSGPGITTSAADAVHTLALLTADDIPGDSFGGIALGQGDSIITYGLTGDTSFDGVITADDYDRLDRGFLQRRSGYRWGDFNYDGVIDVDDYALIDAAFLSTPAALAAVPEPDAAAGIALMSAWSMRRRVRSRR